MAVLVALWGRGFKWAKAKVRMEILNVVSIQKMIVNNTGSVHAHVSPEAEFLMGVHDLWFMFHVSKCKSILRAFLRKQFKLPFCSCSQYLGTW